MTKELQVLLPGLPNTPGWTALSQQKQEWLQQRTSNLMQYRRMEAVAGIGECKELIEIERGLDGEKMSLTNYMRTVYRRSERTAWRRLADFKELGKYWPAEVIEALAKDGANLLRGGAGIGAKDLLSVAKALPAPKGKDEKTIEGFIEQEVRVRIRQDRQKRRKGRQKLDPDDAMKIFVTTSMRLLREARLSDSASQRSWLKKAVGYLMEARAITGTVATERLSIPEGFMPRRGRPRKDKKAA
jgi:hypothetical protein